MISSVATGGNLPSSLHAGTAATSLFLQNEAPGLDTALAVTVEGDQ